MFTTLISTGELAARLGDPSLLICDVRHDLGKPDGWGEDQYRAGHVPGAVFVHLDRDLSAAKTGTNGRHPLPTPEAAAAVFGRLGIATGRQVVAYDQGPGMFAARLWWMLRWLGFESAAVLDGGFAKWKAEGHPVTTKAAAPTPAAFAIRRVLPTVSATGIMASLPRTTLVVLDARAPERFRGDTEPLDPVAGHIPGARNRPYTRNLDADGTFKHPAFLRAEFESVLDGASSDLVVHQCGSGVTACHNMLAMEIAGFPPTRLYPGSWSEWCADPSRPVATGVEEREPRR
jgi:thiosulfate/3-mercaptopyruvate sulfurtransferase